MQACPHSSISPSLPPSLPPPPPRLGDRSYDKRKNAALDLEQHIKLLVEAQDRVRGGEKEGGREGGREGKSRKGLGFGSYFSQVRRPSFPSLPPSLPPSLLSSNSTLLPASPRSDPHSSG